MPDIYNIVDANLASNAAVKQSKLHQRFSLPVSQTGTVAAQTAYLRTIVGANGTILKIQAAITEAVADHASRTVSVDLQKSTGGGSFSTVLSATIDFNSGSTVRAVSTGSLANSTLQSGDILRVVVTVAGSSGNQAQGLSVTVTISEEPF